MQTLRIAPFDGGGAAFQVLVVQQVSTAKVASVKSSGPHSKFWAFRSNWPLKLGTSRKRQPEKRKTKSLKILQFNSFSIKRLKGKNQPAKGGSTKSMKSFQINTFATKFWKEICKPCCSIFSYIWLEHMSYKRQKKLPACYLQNVRHSMYTRSMCQNRERVAKKRMSAVSKELIFSKK